MTDNELQEIAKQARAASTAELLKSFDDARKDKQEAADVFRTAAQIVEILENEIERRGIRRIIAGL